VCNGGWKGYGIVVAGHKQFKCQTCQDLNCPHIHSFSSWNAETDEEVDLEQAFSELKLSRDSTRDRFKCVSTNPLPWPVSDKYKKKKRHVDRSGFPKKLAPPKPKVQCAHKSSFHCVLVTKEAMIHRESSVTTAHLYEYRSSSCHCDCRVRYDGQDDLLLNLDDKNLFDLDWLFTILDRANYSICPLKTAYQTAMLARNRTMDSQADTLTYHHLYRAYNCFLRLLSWNEDEDFSCVQCCDALKKGSVIDLICDGIMMGCRKVYLILTDMDDPVDPTPIDGTKHSER
jgi:hypothetical protein